MKLELFLTIFLLFVLWRTETASCRKIPSSFSNNETWDSPLTYYRKPNEYPSGISLSYGPEASFDDNNSIRSRASSIDPTTVKDQDLLQIAEILYSYEMSLLNRIKVNPQGKTRSVDTNDVAPNPFLEISDEVLRVPTIAKLRALFGNYIMDTSVPENVTPKKLHQQDDFLDAIMATNVMRQAMSFLQSRGIVSSDRKAQHDYLKLIWFTLYNRGQGALGSSGFEHVFLNEVNRGKIIGLHSWVYFAEQEKTGHVDYKGYINQIDLGSKGKLFNIRFTHNGLNKPVNGLFVGTSPELEIALYTICFAFRADQLCPMSMGGQKFQIQTYMWRQNGQNLIGSAFPKI